MTSPAPFQLTDSQQVVLTASAADAKGDPVPDTFTWSVDNNAVLTLTPGADTTTVTAVAVAPGNAVVTATDASTPAVVGTLAVSVVGGAPATVTITPGTPEPQA